jgi:hypothetical protein
VAVKTAAITHPSTISAVERIASRAGAMGRSFPCEPDAIRG